MITLILETDTESSKSLVGISNAQQEQLMSALVQLDADVWRNGFSRFDPTDVPSHPLFLRMAKGPWRLFERPLRLWEWYQPHLCRSLLRIRPSTVPTALFHVGMAHYYAAMDPSSKLTDKLPIVCERVLELAQPGAHLSWAHPHAVHAHGWRQASLRKTDVPPSCAHHTARLGLLLLLAGQRRGVAKWVDASSSAADALLDFHRWRSEEDVCTVSYYPDSNDEVINTGADVALLLASLPPEVQTARHRECALGLLRMVLREQRDDGLWNYATAYHAQVHGAVGSPDNHHNAMILAVLAAFLVQPLPGVDLIVLESAIERGLEGYCTHYIDERGGCRLIPGRTRSGGMVGYSEGIRALLVVGLAMAPRRPAQAIKLYRLAEQLLAHAHATLYDPNRGTAAMAVRFGHAYRLGSIRCESGLLMESIAAVLTWPLLVSMGSLKS